MFSYICGLKFEFSMVLWSLIPFCRGSCELKTNGVSKVFQILKKVPLPDRGNKTYSDNGGGGGGGLYKHFSNHPTDQRFDFLSTDKFME